jgi:hypothetical protein
MSSPDPHSQRCSSPSTSRSASASPVSGIIPDPVPLPKFSKALLDLIAAKKLGVNKPTNDQFVEECVTFYTGLKPYLTNDYDRICQGLVKKYPEWRDPFGQCHWVSHQLKSVTEK